MGTYTGSAPWGNSRTGSSARVRTDDTDSAKKAADGQEEIGLGQISKAPAARLKLHLDLAPEDIDREALSALAWGLGACGDDFAIHAFSSLSATASTSSAPSPSASR